MFVPCADKTVHYADCELLLDELLTLDDDSDDELLTLDDETELDETELDETELDELTLDELDKLLEDDDDKSSMNKIDNLS